MGTDRLPFTRTAQAMMPLLSTDGAKSPTLPATVRSWAYGTYVRDQWQLNRKMTASVGVRSICSARLPGWR